MVNFAGKFNLESSENFDEFLKALGKFELHLVNHNFICVTSFCRLLSGVSFMLRQMAKTAKPSIEISIDDAGVYTIKTLSMLKTTVITFKLNEEFEETRQDGKTVKV